MSVINFRRKEIIAKVVYYGPGLSGKTTNVQKIHTSMPAETRGELVSLDTEQDRTLFFDYVPLHLGNIGGFKTKFQIFTVPGQIFYAATRRVVLQSTDGIVFVADSSPDALERNRESLADLRDNLLHYDKLLNSVPFVIQYNKRDLPDGLPLEMLEHELNPMGVPSFSAIAMAGDGVLETLSKISSLVLTHLKASIEGKLSQGKRDPGMVERFEDEEPDDQTLVRDLLAQIKQVRKDEHVAEVNIVDDDEEVPQAISPRRTLVPSPLPPLPSISAVGPLHGMPGSASVAVSIIASAGARSPGTASGGPQEPPPAVPRSYHSSDAVPANGSGGGWDAPAVRSTGFHRPPPLDPASARTVMPNSNGPSARFTGERPALPPDLPSARFTGERPALGFDPGNARVSGERPIPGGNGSAIRMTGEHRILTGLTPPPRTNAERAAMNHQPGDAPPWAPRTASHTSAAMRLPTTPPSSSRAVPVPAGALEVMDIGQVSRCGAEFMVPLTVREPGSSDVRTVSVQFKLVDAHHPTSSPALPWYLLLWLAVVTLIACTALLLALT